MGRACPEQVFLLRVMAQCHNQQPCQTGDDIEALSGDIYGSNTPVRAFPGLSGE